MAWSEQYLLRDFRQPVKHGMPIDETESLTLGLYQGPFQYDRTVIWSPCACMSSNGYNGALQGMLDAQLEHLSRVLTSKHIWALNVGENFQISISAWERFTKDLEATAVGYMYVSEHHLKRTGLKLRMRDAIRVNRKCAACSLCLSATARRVQRKRPVCWGL